MSITELVGIGLVQVCGPDPYPNDGNAWVWLDEVEQLLQLRRMCRCTIRKAGRDGFCLICREIHYEEMYDQWLGRGDDYILYPGGGRCIECGRTLDFMDTDDFCLDCLSHREIDEVLEAPNADGEPSMYFEVRLVVEHGTDQWKVRFRSNPNSVWQDLVVTASHAVEAVSKVAAFVYVDRVALTGRWFDGSV